LASLVVSALYSVVLFYCKPLLAKYRVPAKMYEKGRLNLKNVIQICFTFLY
jgi:hypothetical protein